MTTIDQPARPAADLIAADTAMDAVTLHVRDLDVVGAFYRDAIALTVIAEQTGERGRRTVTMGRGSTPLLVLQHTPDLPGPAPRGSGLFHTAILFDDAPSLAATLARVAQHAPGSYSGSADHLVSEAFYLSDPEGNGVELYLDRSRDTWTWDEGRVRMAALPLDPNAFLAEHLTAEAVAGAEQADAVVGHVHLQVGDVPTARRFYVDLLGFEVTAEMPTALFVSAGGYHHHLAMNTWNSLGAGPRASSIGLGEVAIVVPTSDDLAAVRSRLSAQGVAIGEAGGVLGFADPWRNAIRVSAAA